ncbi:MAG: hypothetical protein CVV22_03320 [Ignavibacteriae bacterium HGW-Ignavibacteriae-1]|nr:MAG: hypothetical protein CVV22_03320 [Ignavibacteriae bacterium HGW-Ignavibacteriae-1]
MYRLILSLIALFAIVLVSCSDDATNTSKAGTFYSETKALGNGNAKSFVELDNSGNPASIGIVFSQTSLDGLGDQMSELVLPVPAQAGPTNVKHITVDWNPMGHEPPGIYDVPHFDMHFYMIDEVTRDGISGMGEDSAKAHKMPEADYIAEGYMVPPPSVVIPKMGLHAIDMTSPEINGGTFTETFIYGYYDGKMHFYEPMITIEYLKTKPNLDKAIKKPAKYPAAGWYPSKLNITFNESTKEYIVKLSGMTEYK